MAPPCLLLEEVESLTTSLLQPMAREEVEEAKVDEVVACLARAREQGDPGLQMACLRALRNMVAGVARNQGWVVDKLLGADFDLWTFCNQLCPRPTEEEAPILRCCTQLLGNLTSYLLSQEHLLHLQPLLTTVTKVLACTDSKARLYSCMPLLALLQASASLPPDLLPPLASCLQLLLDLLATSPEQGTDFLHLCLQSLLCSPLLLPLASQSQRAASCPLLLSPGEDSLALALAPSSLLALAQDFTLATDCLLTTNLTSAQQLSPDSVVVLAEVTSPASTLKWPRIFYSE